MRLSIFFSIIVYFFLPLGMSGQSMTGPSAGEGQVNGTQLAWSVGEPIVTVLALPNVKVSLGQLQPAYFSDWLFPSLTKSLLTANPTLLPKGSQHFSQISVQVNDQLGQPFDVGINQLDLLANLGEFGPIKNTGAGQFTAPLYGEDIAGTSDVFAVLGGTEIPNSIRVTFANYCEDLDEYLVSELSPFPDTTVQASDEILLTGIVNTGQYLHAKAGNKIVIRPGFHAHRGSRAIFSIESCISTTIPALQNEAPFHLSPENQLNISIYPNPSNNESRVFLRGNIQSSIAAHITDISGMMVKAFDFSSPNTRSYSFPIGALEIPSGMYYLVVVNGTEVFSRPFVWQPPN